ncbi:succinate dehydrogenase, cytochrome b556 subunit [Ramlibacter alkalitolerans]|uniref:Succinate dehydrogenase cytochrome b556 subunit n=1 Tax=Ramlibacter alkalitolerans TaxID=2039631 RepID=A0ABS1JPB3_9BURK|nr:succinate dehydrogenase, cytochrome b556 subunit [Ramlibacter alkalitolerans]MBL0426048.1 succinate dehydrogenase, cytochrome b556 subunit [Ramlibacter alkalitolerans]
MTEAAGKRPEFRNINAFRDLPTYRLPVAGIVSILHRISGVLMFVLLPLVMWVFDKSISSEISFARLRNALNTGASGVLLKLVLLALLWAYLTHFFAGLRHVWSDVSHAAVGKEYGATTAKATIIASLVLTVVLGAKLFGLY